MPTRRKEVDLVNSLIEYISDVKPYHTKIKNSSSEVFFEESTNITATDYHDLYIYHQNVWGKFDAGGEYLVDISDYDSTKNIFRLPATIFPRFSLTDHNGIQTPIGNDVSTGNSVDSNSDGIPDADVPWSGANTSSHQLGSNTIPVKSKQLLEYLVTNCIKVGDNYIVNFEVVVTVNTTESIQYGFGSDYVATYDNHIVSTVRNNEVFKLLDQQLNFTASIIEQSFLPTDLLQIGQYFLRRSAPKLTILWTDTGRYAIPIHQGSRVRVNNLPQVLYTDYIVNSYRNWIQFNANKHPINTDRIDINLMKVDKFFLSYNQPFDKGDYFEIKINDSFQLRYESISFVSDYSTDFKAPLNNLIIGVDAVDGEIWRVEAISAWKFKVYRVVGYDETSYDSIGYDEYQLGLNGNSIAYFNKQFTSNTLTFIIERTWLNYYLSEFPLLNSESNVYNFPELDPSDHFVSNNLLTEHGVITDPTPYRHFAIAVMHNNHYNDEHSLRVPIGHIKLISDTNGEEYYGFELYNTPKSGTYIEIRVEQNDQLNPWVKPIVNDCATITIVRGIENDVSIYDICNGVNPFLPVIGDPPIIDSLNIEIGATLSFTSKPYPYQLADNIITQQVIISAATSLAINDNIQSSNIQLISGTLKNTVNTYSKWDTEEITSTQVQILSGEIITFTYVDYSKWNTEELTTTHVQLTSGTLNKNVIKYTQWTTDNIKTSQFKITNATLT